MPLGRAIIGESDWPAYARRVRRKPASAHDVRRRSGEIVPLFTDIAEGHRPCAG
jgi:hypothetical protein